MFGQKFEINKEEINKINSFLPKSLQQDNFTGNQLARLFSVADDRYHNMKNIINEKKELYNEKKRESLLRLSSKLKIFNCELYDAKPLGMVDVGEIHQFSGSTTGDRFAGGLVGYAIEMAIDDVWTKSSKQEEAVNLVKLKLIDKALTIYPETNMIFNYNIDFRELGSTGSVFIYMRGTAAVGKNNSITKAKIEEDKFIRPFIDELKNLELEKEFLKNNRRKIPTSINEVRNLLAKDELK